MEKISILLLIISVSIIFTQSAFAQTEELEDEELNIDVITITTSQKIYEEGDNITISGKVNSIFEGMPVTIQIFRDETLVDIAQMEVAQDGQFTKNFRALGPMWNSDGVYLIRALYSIDDIAEVEFEFFTKATSETSSLFEVEIPNEGTFDIKYTIKGGQVNDIAIQKERLSIEIDIETNSNGWITLELPRENIDAKKQDGSDEIFIILLSTNENEDVIEVSYEEISSTNKSRVIKIDFEEGDKKIEIIGTFVIPEFGTFIVMILLIAIISTVVLTRTKFVQINY